MDLVKKNIVSIVLGVIALLAVVADFYPMAGMREELRTQAQDHASKANQISDLANRQRNLPIVEPGNTEAKPLEGFPTQATVEAGRAATGKVAAEADEVMKVAAEINKHVPLVQNALPGTPGNTFPNIAFAQEYVRMFPPPIVPGQVPLAFPGVGAVPTTRDASKPMTLKEILRAVDPPTDAELQAARTQKEREIEETVTVVIGGQITNQAQVDEAKIAALRTLNEQLRRERAEQGLCYVAPDAFSMFTGMNTPGAVPSSSEIFWAQIGLWVQEDICRAIADINKDKANVTESLVKQVVRIAFVNANQTGQHQQVQVGPIPVFVVPGMMPLAGVGSSSPDMMAGNTGSMSEQYDFRGMGGGGGDPSAMGPTIPEEPTKNPQISPTGRQSNKLFDVVQFELDLIVDAAQVSQVLQGLGAKQYICVIQLMSIEPVDSAQYRGMGYYLGNNPCVRIRVRCEEIFLRSWLEPFVPKLVKDQLQYTPPADQQMM